MQEGWTTGVGVRLRYFQWQPTVGPPASPVVLLHGMSSNALFWLRVAEHMPGRQLVAIDLRGHGRSDRPLNGYSTASMAADVVQAIADLDLNALVLVGHSWGAAVALAVAAGHPQLLSGLVLVDGPTASLMRRMSLEEADREMRPPAPCYRDVGEIEADHARFLGDAWAADLRPFAQASFMRTERGWCPVLPEQGRREMVQALYDFQPEALLPRAEAPTLIVAASDASDGVAPTVLGWWRSQAGSAANLIRCGRLRSYASKHDIPLIEPAELAADIERTAPP